MNLKDKRVIAIGEREGIQGPSLKLLLESAGAKVIYSVTQCFV
jgi:glycine reductase